MEISKELLSAAIDEEVEHVYDKSDLGENYICYKPKIGRNVDINIYELAHKCKVWAKYNELLGNSGYDLHTKHLKGINYPSAMNDKLLNKNYDYWICFYSRYNHISSTIGQGIRESEAIFKACQWILDNKEG